MRSLTPAARLAAVTAAATVAIGPATALARQSSQHSPDAAPRAVIADVNWQIYLSGSSAHRKANGSAQYQAQPGQRELQVEVQRIRWLAGRAVTFWVGGRYFGTARVSRSGQADVNRNTELSQSVPVVTHGTPVVVRTTSGKLIVTGRF